MVYIVTLKYSDGLSKTAGVFDTLDAAKERVAFIRGLLHWRSRGEIIIFEEMNDLEKVIHMETFHPPT